MDVISSFSGLENAMQRPRKMVQHMDKQLLADAPVASHAVPLLATDAVLEHNKKQDQGFTLIELMIVIAILAVLMAIAVPTYTTFVAKAKVSECLYNAAAMKTSISEVTMTMNNGSFPADAAAAMIEPAAMGNLDYCDAALYANTGALTLQVDEAAVGVGGTIEMVLVPAIVGNGSITWNCLPGSTSADGLRYLPASCRS